jgi:hypothetical protein
MARWYATFDNTTNAGLETSYYERVAISGGSTLKANLLSARSALSAAVLAQLTTANQNGASGIVVPTDVITRGGGNLSWTNVYTNAAAIWPSDPSVRPTTQILSSNSTPVSPTDGGTITDSLYTTGVTALESCFTAMTGGGPRARLGVNPWRTLASIYHDHALTYLAWDDYTPGQPMALTINVSNTLVIVQWPIGGSYEFPADVLASVTATFGGTIGGVFYSGNLTVAAGSSQAQIPIGASVTTGAAWDITATAFFSYATPIAAQGIEVSIRQTGTVNNV